jgi:hypothetical protein
LTFSLGTQAANSTVVVNASGTTPKSGFVGSDSFVYIVNDGRGGSASATVGVTVK